MPRPGPRPYECVKRAWHSDRHQPVRGSLIREIFRIANEIHSPATRKNKEWQEKLPSVVLKAEEIMYSKANSEAEYVDLSTLWERANDAVDTIIRRDDVNESGELLQPCIEAALTLGCIPRRASRSQRHSNPRFYLTSSPQEAAKPPPASHSMLHSSRPQMGPAAYLLQPPLLGCAGRSLHSCSTQSTPWMPGPPNAPPHGCPLEMAYPSAAAPSINNNQNEAPPAFRYPADDSPLCNRQGKTLLLGRVYSLYYGTTMTQNVESSSSFLEPVGSSCNGLTVGSAPCGSSARELDAQVFPGNGNGYATTLNDATNLMRDTANAGCDLSLRLGRPSVATPLVLAEDGWVPEVEDMGSSSSLDGGSKFHEPSQGQPPLRAINFGCSFLSPQNHHKGMFLSYMECPGEPLESCSSKRSLEDEDLVYVETSDRKRKALHDDPLVDYGRLRWKLTHSAGQQLHTSERLDS